MSKREKSDLPKPPVRVEGELTDVRDSIALRKIARACIAIARRDLDSAKAKPAPKDQTTEEGSDV